MRSFLVAEITFLEEKHMDNVTLIRIVAGVMFVVVLIILIQRRRKRIE